MTHTDEREGNSEGKEEGSEPRDPGTGQDPLIRETHGFPEYCYQVARPTEEIRTKDKSRDRDSESAARGGGSVRS